MNRIPVFVLALLASLAAGTAMAADPTLHEVYQAVEAGKLQQAEAMMDQVLRDHPDSAKAHFVEAELQAKEGNATRARAELANAERLAPGLPFAKAEAVAQLRHLIEPAPPLRPSSGPFNAAPTTDSGFSWGMLLVGLGLVAAVAFFVRSITRPRPLPAPAYGGGQFGYQPPVGPAGMGPVASGGLGSGILGGLATGAAVGAGMVAGEALMHRVFDGSSHAGNASPVDSIADYPVTPATDYDMGGNDFGVSDGGSWDDGSAAGADDWN